MATALDAPGRARPSVFDPTAPPRARRPLRTGPPEYHHWYTADGVQLRLTRYRGGSKGPVVLTHGLGVSSRIFTLDTVETNLVEHLVARDFDVWLLDYRTSIELPTATAMTTADVIAAIDYPEAIAEVRRLTGAATVQMVVHCFGATVFFMAMLSGALEGVRSAVVSQATAHVDAAPLLRMKAILRLARVFRVVGIDTLNAYTDTDTPLAGRAWNQLLRLYPLPREERCASPTCRRVSFMYSQLYEHAQLAPATHDTLHELFGVSNLAASEHALTMVQAGHVVDAQGRDVYVPHVERLAIPLRIVHGAENACFLPGGSERTLQWLRAHNDPELYSRVVLPDYGHIDCIMGARAADEVFPHVSEHLEQTA